MFSDFMISLLRMNLCSWIFVFLPRFIVLGQMTRVKYKVYFEYKGVEINGFREWPGITLTPDF